MRNENSNALPLGKTESMELPAGENIESQLATIRKEAESFWKNMAEMTEKQKFYYESGLMKEKLGEKEEASRLFELELAKLERQMEVVEKMIEQMKAEAGKQNDQFLVEIQKMEALGRKFELMERKALIMDKFGEKEKAKETIIGRVREAEENKVPVSYDGVAGRLEKLGYDNPAKEMWEKAGKQCEEKSLYEKSARCYEKAGENFQGKAMEMWEKVIEEGGKGDKKRRKKMEERGGGTEISAQDLYETALAYEKLKDNRKAAEKFEEIIEKCGNDKNPKNMLIVSMAYEKLGKKDEALKMREIAGKKEEIKGNFRTAGNNFEATGKLNSAIEAWKKEIEKNRAEIEKTEHNKSVAESAEMKGDFISAGIMRNKIAEGSSSSSPNEIMIYAYDKLIKLLEKKNVDAKKITIE